MKREILEGRQFGDLIVTEYLGEKRYDTECLKCGKHKEMYGNNIKKMVGVTCHLEKEVLDLTGKEIGEWKVLEYIGDKTYRCLCSCGKTKEVLKANLVNGSSTSCGHWHEDYGDLTGKQFGEWKVIEKSGYTWKCECSCGNIGYNMARDLVNGKTKSCGHGYNLFEDISGRTFGMLKVLSYDGSQYYTCECQCENKTIKHIKKADLLNGSVTSCGCNKVAKRTETLLIRYGEMAPNKVNNPRSKEAIEAVKSKENMSEFIDRLGYAPTGIQLSELLGIGLSRTLVLIHTYELEDKIQFLNGSSNAELELYKFIKDTYSGEVIHNDREVLEGKELDIYIPEKKIAIEFNGDYWHSACYKEKDYHLNKTLACEKEGIQLIHIFEHEWVESKDKIKTFIKSLLTNNEESNQSSSIEAVEVKFNESYNFCVSNSIYEIEDSEFSIACVENNKATCVTNISRVSDSTMLINNICFKDIMFNRQAILKTLEYMHNKFQNIKECIIYIDISKETKDRYEELGFKVKNTIEPRTSIINDLEIYDCGLISMVYEF